LAAAAIQGIRPLWMKFDPGKSPLILSFSRKLALASLPH
jgi:hypothetical protein